jgi:ferredoxin-NADP reductase
VSIFSNVEHSVVVSSRTMLADGVVALEFVAANRRDLPPWTPGSHIDLILAENVERQYSLCSDPTRRSTWRVAVLYEADGNGGSDRVHSGLFPGTTLRVRGPRNHFSFDPREGERYLFIAGGIGITPFVAMTAAASAAGADWTLEYAGRQRSTMAFADELAAAGGDRVRLHPSDENARIDLVALLDSTEPGTHVYCCGPKRLLDAVEALRPNVHLERFEAKEFGAPEWPDPFDVELALSGITVTVPPDKSILEVVEENDVLVISSCRKGTCGSCETQVVAGDVEHRDSVLTPEEQHYGDTMMICVSRAAGPTLTLDL